MKHPVDQQVGVNLRRLRKLKGLSEIQLGRCLGVTFQQMQKYESGSSRVSASTLWLASQALDVPVKELYSGLDKGDESRTTATNSRSS